MVGGSILGPNIILIIIPVATSKYHIGIRVFRKEDLGNANI
jgi:hypothetical protein